MSLSEDLKARFPDLNTADVDKYLPLYETTYDCYYGAVYGQNDCDDEIILNLLAHLVTVASNYSSGESIKQVGSESVGSVSVSYVANALDNNDKFFTSSLYGQVYKLLVKKNQGIYFV